jgi:hypothetical protein
MGWLSDVGKFEGFNLKGMLNQIGDNPARILYGSADPFSTNVWNNILGTDDKPIIDQYGGAAPQRYQEAQQAGINTGPGAQMHGVARTIASMYGGQALGGAMGGAGSTSGMSAAGAPAAGGAAPQGLLSSSSPGMFGANTPLLGSGLAGADTAALTGANTLGSTGISGAALNPASQGLANAGMYSAPMAGGVNYTKMGQEMLSEEEKRKQQQQQQRPMAPAMPMQAGGGSFSQFSPYGRGLL